MTFRIRALALAPPVSFRVRGLYPPPTLEWAPAFLQSSAVYGIDFTRSCFDNLRVTQVAVQTQGGNIQWVSIADNFVSFWITWTSSGTQSVIFTVQTAAGETISACATINVSATAALLQPAIPAYADKAFLLSNSVFVQDATGAQPLILG